jgi:hypothetical protein
MMPGKNPASQHRFIGQSGGARYLRDEGERAGDDAPADHDAGDPDPRTDPLEEQVGRHLEQEVGDEEQPGAEPERRLVEPERLVHMQLGEADIDAIEIGNEVTQDQKWNQAPHHLADHALFYVIHSVRSRFLLVAPSKTSANFQRNGGAADKANGIIDTRAKDREHGT